jgi:hypothetical protein
MKIIYPSARYILTTIFSLGFLAGWAQNRQYDIMSDGKVIGAATMVRTVSKVNPKEVKLIFSSQFTPTINNSLTLKDKVECQYRNDTLLTATVENNVNGRTRVNIQQRLVGAKYQRTVNNKQEVCSQPVAKWSFIRFFAERPAQTGTFLSETFGKTFSMTKSGNTYFYTDHFGRKGKFVYDDKGNFVRAYIQTSMEDLEFVLQK